MKKGMCLTLLAAGAMSSGAVAEGKIGVHYLYYQEYDDRVTVGDSVISIENNFGVDYTLTVNLGHDSVSGASPALQAVLPRSGLSAGDVAQFNNAQAATDRVLLGYDPNAEYEVRKVDLEDTRKSGDFALTMRDEERNETTFGASYSEESDYVSRGIFGQYLTYADERKNRSYIFGASWLHDTSDVFTSGYRSVVEEDLDTYSAEIGLSQVMSPESYMDVNLYAGYSRGYLSNHYLTILREVDVNNDNTISNNEVFLASDDRPRTRKSGGISVRFVKRMTETSVLQSSYRYYTDSWKINSHTLSAQASWDLSENLTLMPIYTYYTQTAASFYRDAESSDNRFAATGYGSSDLRLGDFDANTVEIGLSYKLTKDFSIDGSVATYKQSNGFESRWAVAGVTWKF